MRASGILLPVSSLPSRYGIGGFSKEAYDWIDFLESCGQTMWQILPMGHTCFADSPYQAFSTCAGNPYFVSLDALIEDGLLSRAECDAAALGEDPSHIDYGLQYKNRYPLLYKAYERDRERDQSGYEAFLEQESDWILDYALFMALKKQHDMQPWNTWEEPYKMRDPDAIEQARHELEEDISFYAHIQYWFMTQWAKLKEYAGAHGVRIVGDLPIYVACDSVDVWMHPELFQLDEDRNPTAVAGVPPDFFSADGQLWGNPLYDWERHRETGFTWWIDRIRHAKALYDVIRIDHFRGLAEYYAIPYGAETARVGQWMPGPGMLLIQAIEGCMPDVEFIAEDLGQMSAAVVALLRQSELPGMKVLEFAFDDWKGNTFLPHNFESTNYVVYTGTHDNETLLQMLTDTDEASIARIRAYLNRPDDTTVELADNLIRLAMLSIAKYCVIPMQDYLHIGAEGRINFPSTIGGNWEWRLSADPIPQNVADFILEITNVSERGPRNA